MNIIVKSLIAATAAVIAMVSCGNASSNKEAGAKAEGAQAADSAVVYFTSEITPEGLVRVYEALGREAKGRVAVKISTGEAGGHNYLKPELIGALVQKVGGTIVECNTAYAGKRMRTEDHLKVIEDHGFNKIAKVDIMDSEGEIRIPVQDTTWIKYDIVGSHLPNYDFMINLAHFKGHAMGGFGGVLKNQSIGVASANGKTNIHTAGKAQTVEGLWQNLPANWSDAPQNNDPFIESMAAAAQGVANYFGDNILYIDVLNNISIDCDCDSHPADPTIKDIGIAASLDPVALDKFCLDQVFNLTPSAENDTKALLDRINARHGTHIVDYGEKIGLGTTAYKVVNIDK